MLPVCAARWPHKIKKIFLGAAVRIGRNIRVKIAVSGPQISFGKHYPATNEMEPT